MENFEKYIDILIQVVVTYGPKLIGGILVLIFGFWFARIISRSFGRLMERRKLDASLRPFLTSLVSTGLKILVIITALSIAGVEMTSFIALLGAAGLAVGMALSGTLQNFAGGAMILIFKPFKVGDYIDAQGYSGTVKEIQIFNTILNTPDNKIIILPNGGLSGSSMVNYSDQVQRRVDWTFGVAYGEDIEKVRSVINKLIEAESKILKDPAPFVKVGALADSSVNFTVRAWVIAADYWDVFFDMNENIYKEFNKEGISIPFPQMDVHLAKTKE